MENSEHKEPETSGEVANPVDAIVSQKPKFTAACNNCGLCCKTQLCDVAIMAYGEGCSAPCPILLANNLCGIVVAEKEADCGMVSKMLGIGCGCSMPDELTTDEEIIKFDTKSYINIYA